MRSAYHSVIVTKALFSSLRLHEINEPGRYFLDCERADLFLLDFNQELWRLDGPISRR